MMVRVWRKQSREKTSVKVWRKQRRDNYFCLEKVSEEQKEWFFGKSKDKIFRLLSDQNIEDGSRILFSNGGRVFELRFNNGEQELCKKFLEVYYV